MKDRRKLVRDHIPALLEPRRRSTCYRLADSQEKRSLLMRKIDEEVDEYRLSGDPRELADLVEVVHALAQLDGWTPEQLERERARKAAERGAFDDAWVLLIDDSEDPSSSS
jgi:predicted house-cleaning noncanonical NTP pyrophosphatase (MazG superfamily)